MKKLTAKVTQSSILKIFNSLKPFNLALRIVLLAFSLISISSFAQEKHEGTLVLPTASLSQNAKAIGLAPITCLANDVPLEFKKIKEPHTCLGIIKAIAPIDENTWLSMTYNVHYQIGGRVTLRSNETSHPLLLWDNGFTTDILFADVVLNDLHVSCRIHPR